MGEAFDELWESDENSQTRDIDGINIYRLDAKIYLKGIYQDELDSGERIIFADNTLSCEEKFNGLIGGDIRLPADLTGWPKYQVVPTLSILNTPKRKAILTFRQKQTLWRN